MSLQTFQRFGFDRVFSAEMDDAPGAAAAAPVPSDLQLEIEVLRTEIATMKAEQGAQIALARAQGFDAGLAQARSERDVALLSAVDALQAGIEALDERFDEVARQLTSDAADVALTAADMIAGRALRLDPDLAIDEAIGRALSQVARGTEIEVRVNPELIEPIEARIADRQTRDRRRLNLVVVGDVTVAPGDAVIGWEAGGLAVNADARRAAVRAELETLLPH